MLGTLLGYLSIGTQLVIKQSLTQKINNEFTDHYRNNGIS